MTNNISRAVAIFRKSSALDDRAVFNALVAEGLEAPVAARLVVFLPMVYARLLLEKTGARFPDKFRSVLPDGRFSALTEFSDEPLWIESMEFAKAEIASGVRSQDLMTIGGRSAEFDAANQLLNRGSKLSGIAFDTPTIRWP
jgi:hypothetical protein